MTDFLRTYLHDHLAGAQFAVGVIEDLTKQDLDPELATFSAVLLQDVQTDKASLEDLVAKLGGDASSLKDVAAWISQKAARVKFNLNEPFGRFEAIEMLCLGVQGKLALWTVLERVSSSQGDWASADFKKLQARAHDQHQRLEFVRLRLAAAVFG